MRAATIRRIQMKIGGEIFLGWIWGSGGMSLLYTLFSSKTVMLYYGCEEFVGDTNQKGVIVSTGYC